MSGTIPQKFLVTGATGFVGSYLVNRLAESFGPEGITALVHPHRAKREEQVFQRFKAQGIRLLEWDLLMAGQQPSSIPDFHVVYHLAGYAETEDVNGPFAVNSLGTKHLIDWLQDQLPGKRFIYTGTLASIDRKNAHAPATEKTSCTPATTYGQTKLEGENIIRSAATKLQFDYTILRLCTIIGQGYRRGGMFGVFPDLLARGALATRLNWPGRASFMDVRDLVEILLRSATHPKIANQLFVLGTEEGPTYDDLLALIAEVLELPRKRLVLPGWFWKAVARFSWFAAASPLLPRRWQIPFWRLAHLTTDGILADGTKLNSILGMKYRTVREALVDAYKSKPQ